MKKTIAIILVLLLAVCLIGCAAPKNQTTEASTTASDAAPAEEKTEELAESPTEESANKTFEVGILASTAGDHQRNITAALTAALDQMQGVSYTFSDHQSKIELEISQAEDLIAQNVDCIVLSAVDTEALIDAIKEANAAGIPVIQFDMHTSDGEFTFVGSDDEQSAVIQAEYLAEVLPENSQCCILMGRLGHSGQIHRSEGIKKLFELRPDVKLLAEESGNWKNEQGMTITENWLQMYPDLNCIISQNDNMALGAIEAISGSGREQEMYVVGVDALPAACEAIKAGTMTMTVFNDGPAVGAKIAEVIQMIMNGETPEESYLIPYKAVTMENVDEYLNR